MSEVAWPGSGLVSHYRKLAWFMFHRFEEENYQLMREYFARVMVEDLKPHFSPEQARSLDVGGAEGAFARVVHATRGWEIVNVEPSRVEAEWGATVRARAERLPFRDEVFDLVVCRGVVEHIPPGGQETGLEEIFRVTRRGGYAYLAIPPWYNPHAGHQLKPFHYFPFSMAKRLRRLAFRDCVEGSSYEEVGLYRVTFRRMRKLIEQSGFRIVATKDPHFRLHFLTRVPLLREVLVPVAAFVVQKP